MTLVVRDPAGAMTAAAWQSRLRVPVIGAPMFLISSPALVVAQCTSGVIGTFPALNARPAAQLDEWLADISDALSAWDLCHPGRPSAPFGVNLTVHRSNPRLEEDLALCVKYRVPLVISSMGAREDVNRAVQAYGGVTLHDVTTVAHARKAIDKGASGLIAVASGAGGHAGRLSPFALIEEIRQWFGGPLVLGGAIASGRGVAAARAMGADFAYVGSAFIATEEANASAAQKLAVVTGAADDIVYTDAFSGAPANFMKGSIIAAGYDPENLTSRGRGIDLSGESDRAAKTWKDIWGCGQGIGIVDAEIPVTVLIDRLAREFAEAQGRLAPQRNNESFVSENV